MTAFYSVTTRRCWCALLIVWFAGFAAGAHAADVTVRATLSSGVSTIGNPVQYQIKITGARQIAEPPEIDVDGLVIRYAGPSETSVMRFRNGSFSSERTTTLVYQVVPERHGTFTIPPVMVEADGRTFRTEQVGLKVQPNTGTDAGNDAQPIGFAEFVVPKKTAYIGETIPVELRLYVDARVRWQPVSMPEIEGEGFTKQKLPEPTREQVQKNGREYDLLIFKTAITPSRAGKITIGPSEIPYNARVPRARRGGPRSLFDMFDDDVFGDPFFSSTQQMKAKAGMLEITVKPLPAAGKPRDFSGAVGHFEFTAEGRPKQVKVGDPVAMTLRVSGRGNFDRMTAPVLKDPTGWRTYPPTSAFEADDEINYNGTKTFEYAVVPEERKTEMPIFEFSYFDPLAEKYVTLHSETAPLTVERGAPPATPPPTVAAAPESRAEAPPAPAPVNDIVGLRYDRESTGPLVPIHLRREFWYAQGVAGCGLLLLLGLRLRRRPDEAERAAAELRREKAAALGRLRNSELGRVEFLETAARVAQIETALATGRSVGSVDAEAVQNSGKLSASTAEVIDEIFAARAELLYAGGGSVEGSVTAAERERVLGALQELEKSHGRS
jgi:hypothetical protein